MFSGSAYVPSSIPSFMLRGFLSRRFPWSFLTKILCVLLFCVIRVTFPALSNSVSLEMWNLMFSPHSKRLRFTVMQNNWISFSVMKLVVLQVLLPNRQLFEVFLNKIEVQKEERYRGWRCTWNHSPMRPVLYSGLSPNPVIWESDWCYGDCTVREENICAVDTDQSFVFIGVSECVKNNKPRVFIVARVKLWAFSSEFNYNIKRSQLFVWLIV